MTLRIKRELRNVVLGIIMMSKTVHSLDTVHQRRYDIPILIIEVEEVNILLGFFHRDFEAFSKSVLVLPGFVSEQT